MQRKLRRLIHRPGKVLGACPKCLLKLRNRYISLAGTFPQFPSKKLAAGIPW